MNVSSKIILPILLGILILSSVSYGIAHAGTLYSIDESNGDLYSIDTDSFASGAVANISGNVAAQI